MNWKTGIVVFAIMLAVGIAAGLAYAWMPRPAGGSQIGPDALDFTDRVAYLALVGDLYADERDLERAKQRLALLGVRPNGAELASFIERYLDDGGQLDEMRNLARLARDLGATGGVLRVFGLPTPGPTAASTRLATPSPGPAATGSPVPSAAAQAVPEFRLTERTAACGAPGQPGRIAVRVRDQEGKGMAGVEVTVSWGAGEDRFFTGLRPERGPGYADFEMSSGTPYDVSLTGVRSEAARGLSADLAPGVCPTSSLSLDWQIVFQQIP